MKLAFCLFHYYPYGGLERDFMRIATAAQQRGHTVHVFTMAWVGDNPHHFPITYLPAKGFTNHARCAAFAAQLQHHLKTETYDLVIGFNRMPHLDVYYAADVCYQASAKQKHGTWYRLTPRYKTLVALEKAVFTPAASTKILSLVPSQQTDYTNYYQTPSNRFYAVPPGIDKQRMPVNSDATRSSIRHSLTLTNNDYFLLMVGSDFARKGVDRALHALAALPSTLQKRCQLFVVGKGKTKPLLTLAKKLAVAEQLHFLGPRNDVGDLMVAADVLLHPARQETAGMVLLEALVAHLPILTTANCGYAFHVARADAGLVIPIPYQQHALNEALASMLISAQRNTWRDHAKNYADSVDLYSLPQYTVTLLEQFHRQKITDTVNV